MLADEQFESPAFSQKEFSDDLARHEAVLSMYRSIKMLTGLGFELDAAIRIFPEDFRADLEYMAFKEDNGLSVGYQTVLETPSYSY